MAVLLAADRRERYAEFQGFYEEHYARCARYCFRLVRDEEAARDLAQESFASLLTRWFSLRDPAAYLFHVATNLARASWQRRERERRALAAADHVPPDRHHRVHLAVERLPRRYRELVLLYYFADLPVAAVAAAVRRPEGTVKRQLAEARALLAPELENPDASLLD